MVTIGGFIGKTVNNVTTTYERGGSDRTGKSARISEKIRKKIGIDMDIKPAALTEESLAKTTKDSEELEISVAPAAKVKSEKKIESPLEKK